MTAIELRRSNDPHLPSYLSESAKSASFHNNIHRNKQHDNSSSTVQDPRMLTYWLDPLSLVRKLIDLVKEKWNGDLDEENCSSTSKRMKQTILSYSPSANASRRNSHSVTRYEKVAIIGSGSFGKVFLCQDRQTRELVAIKTIEKSHIRQMGQIKRTLTERQVLSLKHPFLVRLYRAFQSTEHLYFVLEYCPGGDFFTLLDKRGRLSEASSAFYGASLVLVLQYLHQHGIIYRDLKPENVMLDQRGFIRLVDFGLIKQFLTDDHDQEKKSCHRTFSICGSSDYLAPEILDEVGYTYAVDYYSLGCVIYELLTGYPPFYSDSSRESRNHVPSRHSKRYTALNYPDDLSPEAQDLVQGLLCVNPSQRLGCGPRGPVEIIEHPFFQSVNWYKLGNCQLEAPCVPKLNSAVDLSNFALEFTSVPTHGLIQTSDATDPTLSTDEFKGFDWYRGSDTTQASMSNPHDHPDTIVDVSQLI